MDEYLKSVQKKIAKFDSFQSAKEFITNHSATHFSLIDAIKVFDKCDPIDANKDIAVLYVLFTLKTKIAKFDSFQSAKEFITNHSATHFSLIDAIKVFDKCDPIDANKDIAVLYVLFTLKTNELLKIK